MTSDGQIQICRVLATSGFIGKGYELLNEFHEGLASVRNGGKWGFVDEAGCEVIPCQYKEAGDFHEGLAPVTMDDGAKGYVDKTGCVVLLFG